MCKNWEYIPCHGNTMTHDLLWYWYKGVCGRDTLVVYPDFIVQMYLNILFSHCDHNDSFDDDFIDLFIFTRNVPDKMFNFLHPKMWDIETRWLYITQFTIPVATFSVYAIDTTIISAMKWHVIYSDADIRVHVCVAVLCVVPQCTIPRDPFFPSIYDIIFFHTFHIACPWS